MRTRGGGTRPACARAIRVAAVVCLLAISAACGSVLTSSSNDSSAFLIVDSLQGAAGATPDKFSGVVASDVQTIVLSQPAVYEDIGQVILELGLKDPGSPTSPASPTTSNYITITHYHVKYVATAASSGGSVPVEFDGGMTVTVGSQPVTATFALVLSQAKTAMPLVALVQSPGEIATIAQVTFYGTDQTGHAVTVTAQIAVNFADWPDPVQ